MGNKLYTEGRLSKYQNWMIFRLPMVSSNVMEEEMAWFVIGMVKITYKRIQTL